VTGGKSARPPSPVSWRSSYAPRTRLTLAGRFAEVRRRGAPCGRARTPTPGAPLYAPPPPVPQHLQQHAQAVRPASRCPRRSGCAAAVRPAAFTRLDGEPSKRRLSAFSGSRTVKIGPPDRPSSADRSNERLPGVFGQHEGVPVILHHPRASAGTCSSSMTLPPCSLASTNFQTVVTP